MPWPSALLVTSIDVLCHRCLWDWPLQQYQLLLRLHANGSSSHSGCERLPHRAIATPVSTTTTALQDSLVCPMGVACDIALKWLSRVHPLSGCRVATTSVCMQFLFARRCISVRKAVQCAPCSRWLSRPFNMHDMLDLRECLWQLHDAYFAQVLADIIVFWRHLPVS